MNLRRDTIQNPPKPSHKKLPVHHPTKQTILLPHQQRNKLTIPQDHPPKFTDTTPPQNTRKNNWYIQTTYTDNTTTTLPAKPTPYDAIRHARTTLGDYTNRAPIQTITLHPHPTTNHDTAYTLYDSQLQHNNQNPAITDLEIILKTHERNTLTELSQREKIATSTTKPNTTHTPETRN